MLPVNEVLDAEIILSFITPKNREKLAKIEVFDAIDSTNQFLLQCTKNELTSARACIANCQTAGRGRQGKVWHSPPGANIYCSLLWKFEKSLQELSGLSLAVGVMVTRVLSRYGVNGLQLKWPNDVLFSDKKLAGILLESNQPGVMVIGIGINLYLPKTEELISLADITQTLPGRNELNGLLIDEMLTSLPLFSAQGLTPFMREWEKYDVFKDQLIVITQGEKKITGQMKGINAQGELLLENDAGEILKFHCGTVSMRKA